MLLELRAQYKALTGEDPAPSGGTRKKDKKADKENKQQKNNKKEEKSEDASRDLKKVTRLGLEARKEENLPDWYSQVNLRFSFKHVIL